MSEEGRFSIPARIFLTAEQRRKLDVMVRDHDLDLSELLSELVVSFLEHLPDYAQEEAAAPVDEDDLRREIRQRRSEIRRLRTRARAGGEQPAAWLTRYIADLENEIQKLEQQLAAQQEG